MGKPASLAQCVRGKLIDAVSNFADTFNWVARFCYYLKAGNSISLATTPDDRSTIDIKGFASASDGTVPTKSGNGIEWKSGGGSITVTSASDSNVVATVTSTSTGTNIEIGVYYV